MENFEFTTSDGVRYICTETGIHQLDPKPFVYDQTYCAIYDDPDRERKSQTLQAARLGFIMAAHSVLKPRQTVHSILDYGCGNYAFLNEAKKLITSCYGYDVADYPVPDGIEKFDIVEVFANGWDVVTFNDCLEHIHDPRELLESLSANLLVVSLPNLHRDWETPKNTPGWIEYFETDYFHRKPNEHVHHFGPENLEAFMLQYGWKMHAHGFHEDIIRQRGSFNILTMAFKR